MRERLLQFERVCQRYELFERSPMNEQTLSEVAAELATLEPTIREIFKRIDPQIAETDLEPSYTSGVYHPLRAVRQALGILRDQDEWTENLAPDAPSVIADQFHPRIWAAASVLWDTGQYRVAVGQAATALSTHIAAKARSHLADRKLVSELFAPADPPVGKARLHMPGNKGSETWQSRQAGLHLTAQGAFAGIRNVAAHTDQEWPEQVALEHLAVLSVIARWTDETEIISG